MLPRVRAVSLFNYIEIAASVGLDPYRLLRDAQIDPALLAHPENWLGARPVGDLLERSARNSDRDDFALLLAECRTFASLGPISLVLKHQETLGQVIARLQEYRTRLNDVIGLALAVSEDVAIVQWTVVPEFAGPQIECLVSAVGYRALTEAMGRSWKPECVHFAMARPVEIQSYQRFFQCDLHFGAPFNGLSFNAGQLDMRNRGSDPALAQHAERLLKLNSRAGGKRHRQIAARIVLVAARRTSRPRLGRTQSWYWLSVTSTRARSRRNDVRRAAPRNTA